MTLHSIWGAGVPGVLTQNTDGQPTTVGQVFVVAGAGTYECVGARYYVAADTPKGGQAILAIHGDADLTLEPLRSKQFVIPDEVGWLEVIWDAAQVLNKGVNYAVSVRLLDSNIYMAAPQPTPDPIPSVTFPALSFRAQASRSLFRYGTGSSGFSNGGAIWGVDVVVDDGEGGSEPLPNVPPVARAGADQSVASQAAVTLTGSTSSDADGVVSAYAWEQTSGPAVILNGAGAARTFTAPEGPAALGFRLTVTDDDGAASQDSVTVTVAAPVTPTAPGSSLLTAEDLAYMRETQAEARPTEAELIRVTQGATPSGGRGNVRADPEPIRVRLDGKEKSVPNVVAAVIGSAKAVKVTMDMVEVSVGDFIAVDGEKYQVITGADPDRWATAQVVWTKRVKGG